MTKGQLKRQKRNDKIFWYHKKKKYSLGQISRIFRLSRERIRQIIEKEKWAVDKKT